MELCYLRGSPWSLRTIWAIKMLPENVLNDVEFKAIMSANSLRGKVKKCTFHKDKDITNDLVTVPMLFYKNSEDKLTVIRESFDIIEFFCQKAGTENEFAKTFLSNQTEMLVWSEKADIFGRYFRSLFGEVGFDLTKYLLPKFLTYIPFLTDAIGKHLLKGMNEKFGDYTDDKTFAAVLKLMDEVDKRLKTEEYLFGKQFSFADIAFYSMFECSFPVMFKPPLTIGAVSENAIKKNEELKWKNRYEAVFKAHKKILKNNMRQDIIEICKMSLNGEIRHAS